MMRASSLLPPEEHVVLEHGRARDVGVEAVAHRAPPARALDREAQADQRHRAGRRGGQEPRLLVEEEVARDQEGLRPARPPRVDGHDLDVVVALGQLERVRDALVAREGVAAGSSRSWSATTLPPCRNWMRARPRSSRAVPITSMRWPSVLALTTLPSPLGNRKFSTGGALGKILSNISSPVSRAAMRWRSSARALSGSRASTLSKRTRRPRTAARRCSRSASARSWSTRVRVVLLPAACPRRTCAPWPGGPGPPLRPCRTRPRPGAAAPPRSGPPRRGAGPPAGARRGSPASWRPGSRPRRAACPRGRPRWLRPGPARTRT